MKKVENFSRNKIWAILVGKILMQKEIDEEIENTFSLKNLRDKHNELI